MVNRKNIDHLAWKFRKKGNGKEMQIEIIYLSNHLIINRLTKHYINARKELNVIGKCLHKVKLLYFVHKDASNLMVPNHLSYNPNSRENTNGHTFVICAWPLGKDAATHKRCNHSI